MSTVAQSQVAGKLLRAHLMLIGLLGFVGVTLRLVVDEVRNFDGLIVGSFLLNGALSLYGFLTSNVGDGISFRVIFWFFNLFFLTVAPLAQYLTGTWIFEITDSTLFLTANALILAFSGAYMLGYRRGTGWARRSGRRPRVKRYVSIAGTRLMGLSALSVAIAAVIMIMAEGSWSGAVVNRVFGVEGLLGFAVGFVVRPMVFFAFLLQLVFAQTRPKLKFSHLFMAVMTGLAALSLNFPSVSSRFYVFAIYLGLLAVLRPPTSDRWRSAYLIFLLVLVSFVPHELLAVGTLQSFSLASYFYSGNFDTYENFLHGIEFVRDNGIVWGKQLLGPLFFWVPRAFWSDKPVGTGAFVASTYLTQRFQVWYSNLSAPLIEEGYINFSMLGIVVFGLIAGMLTAFADLKYREHLQSWPRATAPQVLPKGFTTYRVLYPVAVGLFLFVLRGDLLSSTAYTFLIVLAFIVANTLILKPVTAISGFQTGPAQEKSLRTIDPRAQEGTV